MKKTIYTLLIIAAAAGCAKTDNNPSWHDEMVMLTFETEFAQTPDGKSYLEPADNGKIDVIWHAGDQIAMVPVGKTGNIATVTGEKYFSTTDGGKTATFEGQTYQAESYVGIYPVDGLDYIQDDVKVLFKNIYENQNACNGNLDKNMLISVSLPTANGETMYFYNVCGLIKFTIPESLTDITKVAFRGGNGEKLAGRIKIDYGTEIKTTFQELYEGQRSSNTLTLSNPDGSALSPGTYYMVALPTSLEKGFTIAMYGADGKRYVRSTTNDTNVIERSGILDLGTLDLGEITPSFSELFLMAEGNSWSFEPMTRYPLDKFTFRYGGNIKQGQFKFGTTSGSWDKNYKALEMDNADGMQYEDATFISGTEPDWKWYLNVDSEEGKDYRIILDITNGVEKMHIHEFTDYKGVWMVGNATPKDWSMDDPDELTLSEDEKHTYSWTGDLKTGEIKFSLDKDLAFDGKLWLMAPENGMNFESGDIMYTDLNDYPETDNKWMVNEAGNYTITINTLTEKMTVIKNETTEE